MPVRFKAFLQHLACSALLALLTLLLVFQFWYPAPLHQAVGVTRIFLLLLLVDVVIGPLLTLIVFKAGKKSLVFDLAAILVLQLAALGYGLWTVGEGRPAWLVFHGDRFDLVLAQEIDASSLDKAAAEYRHPSWIGPRWVGAVKPESAGQSAADLRGITLRPDRYRPLTEVAGEIRLRAQPLERLSRHNEVEQVDEVLARWPQADGWLPLLAHEHSKVVLLDRKSAEVVAIVDLAPWK